MHGLTLSQSRSTRRRFPRSGRRRPAALLLFAVATWALAVGCDDEGGSEMPAPDATDATLADTALADTTLADTTLADTLLADTGAPDATEPDTASPDTTSEDAGDVASDASDAGPADATDATDAADVADTAADTVDAMDAVDMGDVASMAPLVINELVVTPNAQEALEIYNPTMEAVSLDGWRVRTTSDGMTTELAVAGGRIVPAMGWLALRAEDLGGGDGLFRNSGALVTLVDGASTIVDEVAYGLEGDAPAPIFSYSVARLTDGLDTDDDLLDFQIDAGPSMGSANTVFGTPALGQSPVAFNEIFADADMATVDFFELHNSDADPVDISGWQVIIGGDEHVVPAGTVLAAGGEYVVTEADFPDFTVLDGGAGVGYLFDGDFDRIHQITWGAGTDCCIAVDGSSAYGFLPDGNVLSHSGLSMAAQGIVALSPSPGADNTQ